MKDKKVSNYVSPQAVFMSNGRDDIVCTSGNLSGADEVLTAASWKASWIEKMGLGEN